MSEKAPIDIMKYIQFFIGLAMGLGTLYFSSTQWISKHTELLFEIRELRKDYIKIDHDIAKLMSITSSHEKAVTRYEIKLDMLEVKVSILEKELNEKKKVTTDTVVSHGKLTTTMALNIAAYIIKTQGIINAQKMHKLLFYCQERALKEYGVPVFAEKIVAWDYGSAIPSLYHLHRGKENISWSELPLSKIQELTTAQKGIVLDTLSIYWKYDNHVLAEMNYANKAYIKARKDLGYYGKATGQHVIKHEYMLEKINTSAKNQ